MDAVSAGGESNVGAAGDENLGRVRGCDGLNDAAGESDQGGGGKVLFSQEEEGYALPGETGALRDQGVGV